MAERPLTPTFRRPISLGKYEVVEHIAAGGMAAVYRAFDREMGQEVALKVLPSEFAANPRLLKRFEREALAAAKLRHENIVAVYELDEENGTHFIAMEYVPGTDLHRYLYQRGKLEVEEGLDILRQAALALDHAHDQGIVHRDIKPSNFLLTLDNGRPLVKMTDFGLALDKWNEGEGAVTKLGTTVGTIDYMAPEQARSGHLADIRSDLYSLGCTFYHMLTGRPPFPGGTVVEKAYKHALVLPDDPRDFNADIPPEVLTLLSRLLEKQPESRYQTPADLLLELEKLEHWFSQPPWKLLAALSDGVVDDLPRSAGETSKPSLDRPALRPQAPPPHLRDWRSETHEDDTLEDFSHAPASSDLPPDLAAEEDPLAAVVNGLVVGLAWAWEWKLWLAAGGVLIALLLLALAHS